MQKKQDIMNGDNLIFISSFFDLLLKTCAITVLFQCKREGIKD